MVLSTKHKPSIEGFQKAFFCKSLSNNDLLKKVTSNRPSTALKGTFRGNFFNICNIIVIILNYNIV